MPPKPQETAPIPPAPEVQDTPSAEARTMHSREATQRHGSATALRFSAPFARASTSECVGVEQIELLDALSSA